METPDKMLVKLKLAACLRAILAANKATAVKNELSGTEDVLLVASIRQLEATSALSYTILQGVFSAERDLQFSSLIGILKDGFGLSVSAFAAIYDSITEEDIKRTKKEIAASKRKGPRAKKK